MVELEIKLPVCEPGYLISAVYKITFDDDFFYIGASKDLKTRASAWKGSLSGKTPLVRGYTEDNLMIQRIRRGGTAILEIVELCLPLSIADREAYYLHKFESNDKMLSKATCAWKPVLQYTKEGKFVKKHVSIKAAARYNSCKDSKIQMVLNGERGAFHGAVFIYEHDYQKRRKEIIKDRYLFNLPKKTKQLKINQCTENGDIVKTFTTYAEAGRAMGVDSTSIKRALSGRQRTAGGFFWKYA